MEPQALSNDELEQLMAALRREVAEHNHVVLGKDDPLMMLLTCNEFFARRTAAALEQAQHLALGQFRQALELVSQRWSAEGQSLAERTLSAALAESTALIQGTTVELRAQLATLKRESKLERDKSRALVSFLATALAVVVLWAVH